MVDRDADHPGKAVRAPRLVEIVSRLHPPPDQAPVAWRARGIFIEEERHLTEVSLLVDDGIGDVGMLVVVFGHENGCAQENRAVPEGGEQLALDLEVAEPLRVLL